MTKRILSLILAIVMLLGICMSSVSCQSLNDMMDDYLAGDDGSDDTANNGGDDTDNSGGNNSTDDEDDDEGDWVMPEGEYTIPREPGCNQLTIYISLERKGAEPYDPKTSDLWCWWEDKAGQGYLLNKCDYGYKIVLNIPETIKEVGFIARKYCSDPGIDSWASAQKMGTEENRFIAMEETGDTVIYLKADDAAQYSSRDGGKLLK